MKSKTVLKENFARRVATATGRCRGCHRTAGKILAVFSLNWPWKKWKQWREDREFIFLGSNANKTSTQILLSFWFQAHFYTHCCNTPPDRVNKCNNLHIYTNILLFLGIRISIGGIINFELESKNLKNSSEWTFHKKNPHCSGT